MVTKSRLFVSSFVFGLAMSTPQLSYGSEINQADDNGDSVRQSKKTCQVEDIQGFSKLPYEVQERILEKAIDYQSLSQLFLVDKNCNHIVESLMQERLTRPERLEQVLLKQEQLKQEILSHERLTKERLKQKKSIQRSLEYDKLDQQSIEQKCLELENLKQKDIEQADVKKGLLLKEGRLEQERLKLLDMNDSIGLFLQGVRDEKDYETYQSFSKGKLIYRPDPFSVEGMRALDMSGLQGPFKGKFDLSECGDAAKHLTITTSVKTFFEIKDPTYHILIAPYFLMKEHYRQTRRSKIGDALDMWNKDEQSVGLFWRWGGCLRLQAVEYYIPQSGIEYSTLHEHWIQSNLYGTELGRLPDTVARYSSAFRFFPGNALKESDASAQAQNK